MANFCVLLVVVLVAGVSSQSYPRFGFGGTVFGNNSFVFRMSIGEGQGNSLRCVTDNSECCTNGQGNWYDKRGDEVHGVFRLPSPVVGPASLGIYVTNEKL